MQGVRSDSVWPMGEISMVNNNIATVIANPGVFVKAAGVTTLCDCVQLIDMPANNRLRYLGTSRKMLHGACTISMTTPNANQQVDAMLYRNGLPMSGSLVKTECVTANSYTSTALHTFFELNPNDYIELWVANNSSSQNITVATLNLFFMGM